MGFRANADYIVTGFSEMPLLPAVITSHMQTGAPQRQDLESPLLCAESSQFLLHLAMPSLIQDFPPIYYRWLFRQTCEFFLPLKNLFLAFC